MEWRKVNQIDTILDDWEIPEVLDKYHSMGVCGNDKFGSPGEKSNIRKQNQEPEMDSFVMRWTEF